MQISYIQKKINEFKVTSEDIHQDIIQKEKGVENIRII